MTRWQAHRVEPEFTAMSYLKMGIAAVLGAPLLWAITVLFLTMGGAPK